MCQLKIKNGKLQKKVYVSQQPLRNSKRFKIPLLPSLEPRWVREEFYKTFMEKLPASLSS
jgi:hypothetical protein